MNKENSVYDLNFNLNSLKEKMPGDIFHPTPEAYRNSYGYNLYFNSKNKITTHSLLSNSISYSNSIKKFYSPLPYVYVKVDSKQEANQYFFSSNFDYNLRNIDANTGFSINSETYKNDDFAYQNKSISLKTRNTFSFWIEPSINYEILKLNLKTSPSLRIDSIDKKKANLSKSIFINLEYSFLLPTLSLSGYYQESLRLPTFQDLYWIRDAYAEGNTKLNSEKTQQLSIKPTLTLSLRNIDLK